MKKPALPSRLFRWFFICLSFGLSFCLSSVGRSAAAEPHHQGTLSSVNLGLRYSSVLQNRGVILYRDFQIDPVVGIFLFDDRLEYLGDSVGYSDFVYEDSLRLRSRFVSITDKPLFPAYKSLRNSSPRRPDTYEWNTRAEFFLPGYNSKYQAELDVGYAKDLSAHHGDYLDVQAKLKLFSARLPKLGTRIEPNVYASLGWGDGAHNQYFYGPSATQAGINNDAFGLWFAFPEDADRFYPIVQLTHFEVLGERNKSAAFAKERSAGWLFSFIATGGIVE